MSLSLNELESLAKFAARGAGLSWGMAEEAAKASRWLAAHGLDPCDPLVALLFRHDEEGHAQTGPSDLTSLWRGAEGWLCPIACGAALSDLGAAAPLPLTLENVALPVLLLPFSAALSGDLGTPLTLTWPGGSFVTDGTSLDLTSPPRSADVTLTTGGQVAAKQTRASRADPDPMLRTSLNIYATRTRAPATEASRLAGAGAGLTDND